MVEQSPPYLIIGIQIELVPELLPHGLNDRILLHSFGNTVDLARDVGFVVLGFLPVDPDAVLLDGGQDTLTVMEKLIGFLGDGFKDHC